MKVHRATAGKTFRDRERNENLMQTCGVDDAVRWGGQMKGYCHAHVK